MTTSNNWRCFHCGEIFTDEESADIHFGRTELHEPICQINASEFRRLERIVEQHNDEDTILHREIARLQSEIYDKTRRAEELGYARGLEDAKKYPSELGLKLV